MTHYTRKHDLTTQGLELLRPAWAHIDLDALGRNLVLLKDTVGRAQIAAVVKADAYGHGAVHTARALERSGLVDLLAVALPEEGAQLRRAGMRAPILVLGAHLPAQIPLLIEFDLMPTISTHIQLTAWCSRTGASRAQAFHLKVDTGMRRLGFPIKELPAVLDQIRLAKSLELTGVLSHFASSNKPEAQINAVQEQAWRAIEELLTAEERSHAVRHFANSAAALHRPWSRLDMVRVGLALYGIDPAGPPGSAGPADHPGALEAVMSVKARIVDVRQVAAGEGVGYGHRWRAQRDSRVGLLPLGYADGYSWRLGSRAQALAGGHRVEVLGNVSMDMTAIDLTDSSQIEGDEVILLGGSEARGDASISAFDLAEWAGTIPYETLVSFGLRLPRVYVRDGLVVAVSGRLVDPESTGEETT